MATKQGSTSAKIVEALTGLNSSITRREICERTGLSSTVIGGALHHMATSGVIEKHPGPTQRTAGYTLNPDHAPDRVRQKRKSQQAAPTSIKEIASRAASRAANGNGLIQRHVATTLRVLEACLESGIDMDSGNDEIIAAFAAHKEAIELLGSCV